jgi:hypothetical protein
MAAGRCIAVGATAAEKVVVENVVSAAEVSALLGIGALAIAARGIAARGIGVAAADFGDRRAVVGHVSSRRSRRSFAVATKCSCR